MVGFKQQRVILHIDLNSFFASCEQQETSELRGWPVGVVQDSGKRSVIIGSSREAKMIGIGTGASVWESKKIYPGVKIVPACFERYAHYSRAFRKVCWYYTDKVEVFSIDELFMDLTDTVCIYYHTSKYDSRAAESFCDDFPNELVSELVKNRWRHRRAWMGARQVARAIKDRLKVEVGSQFSCSIGIAPNKMLAKLASASQKPDGLVVVEPYKRLEFLDQFELWHICGIGERIEARLKRMGIFTIKQLRQAPVELIKREFGVMGEVYWRWAWGEDTAEVVNYGEIEPEKSFGNQVTLPVDVTSEAEIFRVMLNLSWQVAARMREKGVGGRTVSLSLRGGEENSSISSNVKRKPLRLDSGQAFPEWNTLDVSGKAWMSQQFTPYHNGTGQAPGKACATAWDIFDTVKLIYRRMGWDKPVRFVGISVSNLIPLSFIPLSLFSDEMKQERAASAWDKVAEKYGPFLLRPAALMIGRIKESHLNGFTKRF